MSGLPSDPSTKPLAVLIDADNVNRRSIPAVLAEIATYGTASVRRIYGNWAQSNLKGWEEDLLKHSIQPIQQFSYTKGKNATDIAMVIDAMDLLHSGRFSGFCLVTSDSDFTRLAARIREQGLTVYGFGEEKTPKPFVNACDKFIRTEVLSAVVEEEAGSGTATPPPKKKTKEQLSKDRKLVSAIRKAIDAVTNEESEWASLGGVGSNLSKLMPDFDPRIHGYARLSDLVRAIDAFEVQRKDQHIQIRTKPKNA
ncbi:NYN domain-containing protein [Luteolibacter luteus]|uniref:NYN domain-containing protein n=1 Tax=Luteolibacter luteus TaxID=2728835 RepID=A0A858RIR7_9BACT|nr:NYN domain-containing protein [Luteolibacter luteus]QJE96388.1 NYN domain-containing protein [Luteolibacter luteus]